jgi:hypothetical protein
LELQLYLLSLVDMHTRTCPQVTLSIHVDDVIRDCQGHEDDITEHFEASNRLVKQELERLRMSLSSDNEQTVASSATLAHKLSVQALGGGNSATVQARRLGIDYAPRQVEAQHRNSLARSLPPEDKQAQVRKLRIKQALKRARFAKKLLHKPPWAAFSLEAYYRQPPSGMTSKLPLRSN